MVRRFSGAIEGYGRPTSDESRIRAFQIYVDRGATHGSDVEDWLQAERELQERFTEELENRLQNQ